MFFHVVVDEPTVSEARSMHSLIPVFVKQNVNKIEGVQVYCVVGLSFFFLLMIDAVKSSNVYLHLFTPPK